MKIKKFITILLVVGIVHVPKANSMETVYAVNCGGPAFTDSNGVDYTQDTNSMGSPYTWGSERRSISKDDQTIYKTTRYLNSQFWYDLPLRGDGSYALVLHFSDDSTTPDRRAFNVKFNGRHQLLTNFDMFAVCGMYHVCNQIFYFSVCQGVLIMDSSSSIVQIGQKVRVRFEHVKTNAVIDAIWLVKGHAGERQSVAGTSNTIYFDPLQQKTECDNKDQSGLEVPMAQLLNLVKQIVVDQQRISKFLDERKEVFSGEFKK